MPVIDHSEQPMPEPTDKRSIRKLVSAEHGAESLSISELIVHPGSEGRLHVHDSDEAVMVVEGSIQFVIGRRGADGSVRVHHARAAGHAS